MSSDSRIAGRIAIVGDSVIVARAIVVMHIHTPEILVIHKVATILASHTPGLPLHSFMRAAQQVLMSRLPQHLTEQKYT